ncbi:MAG: DNA alkylation repair protein [Saezia sp.]
MQNIISDIRQALMNSADEQTRNSSLLFFKGNEAVTTHGVKMGDVSKLIKEFFKQIKHLPKQEIFAICDQLWHSGYLEEDVTACGFAYELRKQFEPQDLERFHGWLKNHVGNWVSCDTLCNHTIAACVEMYPEHTHELKQWASSPNRWERRGAAVTLIIPARKGLFLDDIFEIATTLLHDQDDLVQKGYGWMLKAASEAHQQEVFGFVVKYKATMPRTALRYAIEKMPKELKVEAMEK